MLSITGNLHSKTQYTPWYGQYVNVAIQLGPKLCVLIAIVFTAYRRACDYSDGCDVT